jgi:uncharacterized protein
MDVRLLLIGFCGGFASALFGIGAGVLVVPALIFLMGFDVKKAAGTSLSLIVFSSLAGLVFHSLIDISNIIIFFALLAMLGAVFGAWFGVMLSDFLKNSFLLLLFSLFLLTMGIKMIFFQEIIFQGAQESSLLFLIPAGFFAGTASALFGIGGGVLLVPILTTFFGLSFHEAIPTSLAVVFPTSIAGFFLHNKRKRVDFEALKFMVPLSFLGAALGALTANILPTNLLQIFFGILLLFLAVKMLTKEKNFFKHT